MVGPGAFQRPSLPLYASGKTAEAGGLPVTGPLNAKHIAQVAMGPLIKGQQKPDARLNRQDTA